MIMRLREKRGITVKNSKRLAIAFFAVASLMAPLVASATSVNDYEHQTIDQKLDTLDAAVAKIVTNMAAVNPDLSKAIDNFFNVTPPGKPAPEGFVRFEEEVEAAEKSGTMDLNKLQIETIIVDVIKTYVMPKVAKKE